MRQVYMNIKGDRVEKTPESHPYSFDPYCTYYGDHFPEDNVADSDRLYEWDTELFKKCYEEVWGTPYGQTFDAYPPRIEKFLRLYFKNDKLELTGVEKACNKGNGYPYWIFYYKDKPHWNRFPEVYC